MRVLLCCIPFFPSWMLKFIHQNPVMSRSHCFLRVLTVSCPLNPSLFKKLPALTTSVSWGAAGDVSHQWFPQDSQGHCGAWLLWGCLCPDLAPVLSDDLDIHPVLSSWIRDLFSDLQVTPKKGQSCISKVLSWKFVLYTTLRAFKNNPVASFSKKTYVFLKKLILKFIFIVLKYFS